MNNQWIKEKVKEKVLKKSSWEEKRMKITEHSKFVSKRKVYTNQDFIPIK